MSLEKEIQKTKEEAAAKVVEAERLEKLMASFPDIKKHTSRWGAVRYYTKVINTIANRFDIKHSCGCCSDSPLEVWPYAETPVGNVYSDPPRFTIGEKHWMGGDVASEGWKDGLREAGIPEDMIGAMGMHFKRCQANREESVRNLNEDE